MHTLYTFPMSCSLAVQMVLVQHDVPHRLETVERGPARKVGTEGFDAVNPKRKLPTLVLPDGEVLTEVVGVLAHLGEQLAPVDARTQRRRVEWLAFLATELHQQVLGPLFDPASPDAAIRDATERLLPPVLAHVEDHLATRETVLGGPPDGVDTYLFWGLTLLRLARPDSVAAPGLTAFRRRMREHDFVSGPLDAATQRVRR